MTSNIEELLWSVAQTRPASETQPFAELPGWDSLKMAEFVIALQRQLGIRFSPVEIPQLISLSATTKLVAEHLLKRNSGST